MEKKMSEIIQIEIEEEVLLGMNKNHQDLAREMRLAAAVKWYELNLVSQSMAAQLAGLSRAEFIASLSQFGVSAFQETAEEILSSVAGVPSAFPRKTLERDRDRDFSIR
jgi:predicted HTH domain antitoxin